ncbi:MAG: PAS domain-containing protein [Syntrophobacteraceae bacterium]|nr:PAS domain-containing protein [Syntrophobacteraceae bacterium]
MSKSILIVEDELALYRHEADRHLREQREWLRVTLATIGDGALTTDASGTLTFLNPVAAALICTTLEDAVGKPVRDIFRIINEKTRASAEDIVGGALRSGTPVTLADHTVLVTANGREVPIEGRAAPIADSESDVLGVVLVFRDATEKRRADDALQKCAERFRALIRAGSDAVYQMSPDWKQMRCLAGCDFIEVARSPGQRSEMAIELRYEAIIYRSDEDQPFVVEVPELPGCTADGVLTKRQ